MKHLYLLRHGERNSEGHLTDRAIVQARELKKKLPEFSKVVASDIERAIETAKILHGSEPEIDKRAGFFAPAEEHSREIEDYSSEKGVSFFDAANVIRAGELENGIQHYAQGLLQLTDDIVTTLKENECALVISHDLTIVTAMALLGYEKISLGNLCGYIIDSNGQITEFIS